MAKKNKAPKQPKEVKPMNKKTKNILVWTTTGVVVAGTATAITVPLVLASQKTTYTNPFKDWENMKNNPLLENLSGDQVRNLLDNAGLADASLLNEITYQSSFYLYDKEQKGSLKKQMMDFEWQVYQIAQGTGADWSGVDTMMTDQELIDAKMDDLSEIAKIRKQLVQDFPTRDANNNNVVTPMYTDSNQDSFVSPTDHKFINTGTKEGRAPSRNDAKYQPGAGVTDQAEINKIRGQYDTDLARYNDLNAQLKTKKELVNKVIDKMVKLDVTIKNAADDVTSNDLGGGIDYKSSSFSADYPVILLPRDNIKEKQQKIFNDMKEAVVSGYKTREEGLTEWGKQMPTKFNGATTEEEALDSLVHNQVNSTAFTRFELAVNSDYTVKQYKSNIYEDILGHYNDLGQTNRPISPADVALAKQDGVGIKVEASDSDKVYFFGTKSKDPLMVNALMKERTENGATVNAGSGEVRTFIERISEDLGLLSINNAIFPIKQGTTPDAPWTIVKADIIKMFQYMGQAKELPIDLWGDVFQRPSPIEAVKNNPLWTAYKTAKDDYDAKRNAALSDPVIVAYMDAEENFNSADAATKQLITDYDAAADGTQAQTDALAAIEKNPIANAYYKARTAYKDTTGGVDHEAIHTAYIAAASTLKTTRDAALNDPTDGAALKAAIEFDLAGGDVNPIDKELIGRASGTTDSTQWKAGDLGLMTSLNYIKGMTNGWAAGVAAVLSGDEQAIYTNPNGDNVLEGLTSTIIVSFNNLAVEKSRLGLTTKVTPASTSISDVNAAAATALTNIKAQIAINKDWNTDVAAFINSLSDEDINRTFGADIRNYFKNLPSESGHGTVSGMPVAIELERLDYDANHDTDTTNDDPSGVYMTITEEFGIHVMKFNYGTQGLIERMIDDMTKMAEDQDATLARADYAKILTEKLTQARKIEMLMTNADGSDNTEFKDYLKGKIKIDLDGDKNNNETEWAAADYDQKVWDKASDLIASINASEEITTINGVSASTLSTWLSGRIDNRLSGNPLVYGTGVTGTVPGNGESMDPDQIYNDLWRIGGN